MSEYLWTPGREVSVEVLADSNDDVAQDGDAVAVVGETRQNVQVELVESVSDRSVGILKEDPSELADPDNSPSDYTTGDSVGEAPLVLTEYVVWMNADSGYTPTVGDYVQVGDGGDIEAFTGPTATGLGGAVTNNIGVDNNGNLETDNGSDIDVDFTQDAFPFGYVFTTIASEWGAAGKTAVIRLGV